MIPIPKQVIQLIAAETLTPYADIVTRKPNAERAIEISALLILAYCHNTSTKNKAAALNLTEIDLIYFKSQCIRRMKHSANAKKEVAEIRKEIEHQFKVIDYDLVDYSQKTNVFFISDNTKILLNSQHKNLYETPNSKSNLERESRLLKTRNN